MKRGYVWYSVNIVLKGENKSKGRKTRREAERKKESKLRKKGRKKEFGLDCVVH